MKIRWRSKETNKTQKVLRVFMWVFGVSVLVPYIVFSFAYSSVTSVCNYELGTCAFKQDLPFQIMQGSLAFAYWGWAILAPAALLCGLADVIIGFTRQVRKA
jgi:hypothetical protein